MVATVTNFGGLSAAGNQALYYTRFIQLVDAFLRQTKTRGRFMEQQLIDGNKSGRFPVFGRMTGVRFAAGDNIITGAAGGSTQDYLQQQARAEIEIFPDRPLISPDLSDIFDDRLNSIKFRDQVLAQKTNFLARAEDLLTLFQLARVGKLGSETLTGLGNPYDPTPVASPNVIGNYPSAAQWESYMLNCQAAFDDNHVPDEGRMFYMDPTMRAIILADKTISDKILYVDTNAGMANGSYAKGQIMMYAGFELIVSTNMPRANYASAGVDFGTGGAPTGPAGQYPAADLSDVYGIACHSTSLGKVTVGSTGVEVEQEYKIEYQGTLHLAKLHTGQQALRPEAIGVFRTVP